MTCETLFTDWQVYKFAQALIIITGIICLTWAITGGIKK
jgi:hypothetical protein